MKHVTNTRQWIDVFLRNVVSSPVVYAIAQDPVFLLDQHYWGGPWAALSRHDVVLEPFSYLLLDGFPLF